ncbi:MAG: hypothetical protein RLZZ511_968 [Cyanobacteriota bacterium]|jgi:hypothetical protein
MVTPAAIAHNVKTAEDVAATFHLEPNHNPKAGELSQIWFALTKAGGVAIPLENCDCRLAVVQDGREVGQVPLKSIDAEQYRGIPGGDFVFPQVGIYELVFSGKAKGSGDFKPFELKYDVTVQPGATKIGPITTQAQDSFKPENSIALKFYPIIELEHWQVGLGLGIITLGLGSLAWRFLRRGKGGDR